MDERAIYEEILGQLAIIVNQQTQDIVNAINNKKTGEQQQIEVLVSGNTMSIIDVVTNNPETAKRVENVASSFEVLNQQLERYESIFKGIQGAYYNGAGGQVEYIVDFLNILSNVDYISKIAKANEILEAHKDVVSNFLRFFHEFAESISSIPEFSEGNRKTVDAMLRLIGAVTGDGFLKKMVLANIFIGKKTGRRIGEFFGAFAESISSIPEFSDGNRKTVDAMLRLIGAVTGDGFLKKMVLANIFIGKKTGRRIGEFFAQLADELSGIDSGTNVLASVKNITEFLSIVSSVKFISRIKFAKEFYGKTLTGDWMNDPKIISEWFKEFFAGFDKKKLKIRTDVLKNITVFLNKVTSPIFMTKLVLATFVYGKLKKNAKSIGDFFSTFIKSFGDVFKKKNDDKIKNLTKNIKILSDAIDGILPITGKLFLLGVIGTVMTFVLPGLAVIGVVLLGLTKIMDLIVKKTKKNGKAYTKALSTINDCLLRLSFSLLLITAAMILADHIGMGALKIIFPML